MENLEFKAILLNVAICSIACDGDIDQSEISALESIEKNSPYFSSVDLGKELNQGLDQCTNNLEEFKSLIFNDLSNNKLTVVQELTLLEIALRIIAADGQQLDSEKKFVNQLRERLDVEDFIVKQRFGEIDFLEPKNKEFNRNNAQEDDIEDVTDTVEK